MNERGRLTYWVHSDYDDVTRRKYKKDIDALKPDLKAYNAQRQAALGQPSTSSASGSTEEGSESQALIQQQAAESLYRDANSFVYADHKPSEEAIDRVIGKINMDTHKRNKFSRKRNEDGQDVTYINDNNKVRFNPCCCCSALVLTETPRCSRPSTRSSRGSLTSTPKRPEVRVLPVV